MEFDCDSPLLNIEYLHELSESCKSSSKSIDVKENLMTERFPIVNSVRSVITMKGSFDGFIDAKFLNQRGFYMKFFRYFNRELEGILKSFTIDLSLRAIIHQHVLNEVDQHKFDLPEFFRGTLRAYVESMTECFPEFRDKIIKLTKSMINLLDHSLLDLVQEFDIIANFVKRNKISFNICKLSEEWIEILILSKIRML